MNTIVSQESLGYQRMPDYSVATIIASRWKNGAVTYARTENIYYPNGYIGSRIVPIDRHEAHVDIPQAKRGKRKLECTTL